MTANRDGALQTDGLDIVDDLPVLALEDQPRINTELHILPHAARSRPRLQEVAAEIRSMLGEASGLSVAVRIATLDPVTYVALK